MRNGLVDALHFFGPAAARGEHEHGHVQRRFAPTAQQGEPVDFRQAEVEHDRVVGLGRRQEVGALAVACAIDGVAGVAEGQRELLGQHRFVFHHEHAHGH
jgi:hypothetical protein